MSDRTYAHYGTADTVAKKWREAIALHIAQTETLFADYRAGLIDLDALERRCKIHVLGPIDDVTFKDTVEWAHAEARRLGFMTTDK